MALDDFTIKALDWLANKWNTSKADVIRRAVKRAQEEAALEENRPKPLEALDWLQNGGGITLAESNQFREELRAEREAKRYWWE